MVKLNLDSVQTDANGINAVAMFFCDAPAMSPEMTFHLDMSKMTIGEHTLSDVLIDVSVYKCTCCDRPVEPCDDPAYTFKGAISGSYQYKDDDSDNFVTVDVSLLFDSATGDVTVAVSMQVGFGPFSMDLVSKASTVCDPDKGNYMVRKRAQGGRTHNAFAT